MMVPYLWECVKQLKDGKGVANFEKVEGLFDSIVVLSTLRTDLCGLMSGALRTERRGLIIRPMAQNEWQRRIARTEQLGAEYGFAAKILRFYASVARFQEKFYGELENATLGSGVVVADPFAQALPPGLTRHLGEFLLVVEQNGPDPLREAARALRDGGESAQFQRLTAFWDANDLGGLPSGPDDFFARACLQPYSAWVRERAQLRWSGPTPFLCPFCKRKPVVGVLRPLGDGGQRSLVCSFCLAEWEFRRLVCTGCGEEDHAKLPVYTADELKHVRVEACDSCRTYIKTVDMTKTGLAEPVVDEMASIPLDVWAHQQGYVKLQPNLLQF
jgi:formate dehydrogenase accessory protein FdhE